jgi:hypothetical protein
MTDSRQALRESVFKTELSYTKDPIGAIFLYSAPAPSIQLTSTGDLAHQMQRSFNLSLNPVITKLRLERACMCQAQHALREFSTIQLTLIGIMR